MQFKKYFLDSKIFYPASELPSLKDCCTKIDLLNPKAALDNKIIQPCFLEKFYEERRMLEVMDHKLLSQHTLPFQDMQKKISQKLKEIGRIKDPPMKP